MIISSSLPQQRVHEILQRMQTDLGNVECLKTCCGALAILAKDESNKLLIARDGTRLILTVMEGHATRPDLQEAVCDLLWSLAFNNGLVKEVVGRQGGIALILRGMSSHLSSPELIKSACGALSNMCQNTYNQNLIAAHGGVRTILSALQSHRMNAPLLPFVFDALASLIVGNQRNGLLVTDGGGIRGVLNTMALHIGRREVVKSGCHTLAILSDIQGQGARIAGADGVKVLLPALRAHVRFLHLHRIAAIVLLRMLQEAAVARDIASYGGVVIMLGMLREHAREEETVAATVHILYLITHADVMRGEVEAEVGRQFSGIPPPSSSTHGERGGLRGVGAMHVSSRGGVGGIGSSWKVGVGGGGGGSVVMNGGAPGGVGGGVECVSTTDRELFSTGSVRALVLVLQAHMERKDIVRAAMRSAANLIRMPSVVLALVAEASALPTVLQCLALHTTSRGITDSAVAVAGALLAAAHEGGRASSSSSFQSRKAARMFAAGNNTEGAGGGGNLSRLFVLDMMSNNAGDNNGTSAADDRVQQQQQQQQQYQGSFARHQHQQHHQHQLSAVSTAAVAATDPGISGATPTRTGKMDGGGNNDSDCFALRFAYAPLQDSRSGDTAQSGVKSAVTPSVSTTSGAAAARTGGEPSAAGMRRRGAGSSTGPAGVVTSPAAAAAAAAAALEAAQSGSSRTGDTGGWNASMQALCAMLRARRRDTTLAGLVFLALKACIVEWGHACDAIGGFPNEQRQHHQQQREQEQSFGAIIARGRGWHSPAGSLGGAVQTMANLNGAAVATPPQISSARAYQALGTNVTVAAGAASPGTATGQNASRDRSVPHGGVTRAALTFVDTQGLHREARDTSEQTATLRGKMHLGIRESLKAGLVWAEAVPLLKVPPTGPEVCQRGTGAEQGATAATVLAGEVSFDPAMAQAVERLCRLLYKGFAEMGFGRLGNAVPLGEAISLVAFDTSVPDVLENLRAARQPDDCRECVEHLMRTFLPDNPPEPPRVDQASPDPADPSAAPSSTGTEQTCNGNLITGEPSSSGKIGEDRDDDGCGRENNSSNICKTNGSDGGSGSRAVSSNGGGDVCAFVDEAATGGVGLVLSSPQHLEPFLIPSSSISLRVASSSCAAPGATFGMSVTAADETGGWARSGAANPPSGAAKVVTVAGAPNSFANSSSGMLSSKYPGGMMGSDERLWLVYDGASAAGKGVVSKINAPDPYWLGRAPPGAVCPHAHSMEFFSSFESANLLRSVQRGPAEYDLFLRPDLHTHGHTQWFYFAVRGTHPPGTVGDCVVKFNVVNLTKPDSLFAMGMRPVLYSHKDAAERGLGWRRCGHGIDYRSNGYSWYKPDGSQASFYTLSLSVTFPNPGDTYRLAHAHPYSYSDHKRHLAELLTNEHTSRYLNHTVLCPTLGGNECDLLTVTDFQDAPITATGAGNNSNRSTNGSSPISSEQQQYHPQQRAGGDTPGAAHLNGDEGSNNNIYHDKRETAGVGSTGDTVNSAVSGAGGIAANSAKGAGECSNSIGVEDRNSLLGAGVGGRYGSGSGGGLSRRGSHKRCVVISARVHPGETPASWMMRGMLDFITGDSAEARLLRSLFVFKIVPMLNPDGVAFGNNRCSLAGVDLNRQWKRPSRALHPTVFWLKQHIRQEQGRKGVAMYIDLHGHSRKMNIFMYGADEKRRGVSCPSARVFPKLLSWNRLGRKYVSFKDCSFAVKKGREATARVVVARDLGIGNSYTVESTFCGVDFGPLKDHHLNTDHLQEAGVAICDALLDYYLPNQAQRERAHRDLMARDGISEPKLGFISIPPTSSAIVDGVAAEGCGCDAAPSAGGDGNISESGEGRGSAGVRGIAGDERRGQDGEERDVDDDVVDNNDDIESEDDNDSTDAAAEVEGEEEQEVDGAGADNTSDAESPLATSTATPSPQSTPPSGDYDPPPSCPAVGTDTSVRSPKEGRKDDGVGSETLVVATSAAAAARNQPRHDHSTYSDSGGGDRDGDEGGGEGGRDPVESKNPWAGIEWGQAEGESGGSVRRWGRVVQEGDGYGSNGTGTSGDLEPPSIIGQDVITENGIEARLQPSVNHEKRGKRLGDSSERLIQAEAAAAAGKEGAVRVPPPQSGSKKGRRRASLSRAPKSSALSKGNRGRGGSERSIVVRQQRPRGSHDNGGNSDDAARRASDAALQAASSVLAACTTGSSNGPMGKYRHRVRSLTDNSRFMPDNCGNSGGGVSGSASRGSASSSGGMRGGASSKGRNRGSGGSSSSSRGAILARSSSTGGTPESAPRSGSGLVEPSQEGDGPSAADFATTGGVVKRGGNLRWLSPTHLTTGSGPDAEGNSSGVGNLPLTLAQRKGSTQHSPFSERGNSNIRPLRQQTELGAAAPESGGHDGVARGNGAVSSVGGGGAKGTKGSGDGVGGMCGRVLTGRGVIAASGGAGARAGESSATPTTPFALPTLEENGTVGGTGPKGMGGRKVQAI